MATQKGLEPSTSSVTGWHSNQLNYCAIGGNYRARTCACKADALPAELSFRLSCWCALLFEAQKKYIECHYGCQLIFLLFSKAIFYPALTHIIDVKICVISLLNIHEMHYMMTIRSIGFLEPYCGPRSGIGLKVYIRIIILIHIACHGFKFFL